MVLISKNILSILFDETPKIMTLHWGSYKLNLQVHVKFLPNRYWILHESFDPTWSAHPENPQYKLLWLQGLDA